MKTDITHPWPEVESGSSNCINFFEDSFVGSHSEHIKLDDSEEYLAKLYSKLKSLRRGSSKKDLVTSLSVAKEESVARFITSGCKLETEENTELASNPLIRHIAPHLQALHASELVHLLKADVLQLNSESAQQVDITSEISTNNQDIDHSKE